MGFDLERRSAFVTGGSTGIGRASALALARDDAATVVREIRAGGGEALFVRTDISVPEQIEAAVAAAVDAFGSVDCAVNSSAVTSSVRVPTAEVDIDLFDRTIGVHLRGVFLSMKYELRQMARQGRGSVVNISSASGLVATKFNPAYIAAKHGVIGLTKAAAMDYADMVAELGLRIGDALSLQVEDVDLTRGDEHLSVLGKGGR